jgi:cystathionine beta-lyase/cystathionine gamma-synthase
MKTNLATRVIHAGQAPDPITGSMITPIHMSSTFKQDGPGEHRGYAYSRMRNPTRDTYEDCVADLASGTSGFAFASGMAAISTILELLNPGDHIIVCDDIYGGTYLLLEQIRKRSMGIQISYVDLTQTHEIESHIRPETRMILVETPTNPMLKIIDLEYIAAIAGRYNLISVVDNTFASPMIQRPLEYGIDIVIHSATKYLNGHSDMIGGIAVSKHEELAQQIRQLQIGIGAIASPFDSFLAIRGLKTLAIRMERHCHNAFELAQWLEKHPKVSKVIYPGLPSHPQYELAQRQMSYFGGMISIYLRADFEEMKQILQRFHFFGLAVSLGGIESLIEHPTTMSHMTLSPERRTMLGIDDTMLRVSVGIEHIYDLKKDFEEALQPQKSIFFPPKICT